MGRTCNWVALLGKKRQRARDLELGGQVEFIRHFEAYLRLNVLPRDEDQSRCVSRCNSFNYVVDYFQAKVMDFSAESLSTAMLALFVRDRRRGKDALNGGSLRTVLGNLRMFYDKHLIPRSLALRNPVLVRYYPKREPTQHTYTEPKYALQVAEKLMDGTFYGTQCGVLVATVAMTGIRNLEVWRLKVKDFKPTGEKASPCLVIEGKKGKRRYLPVPAGLVKLLDCYIRKFCRSKNEYLFRDPLDGNIPFNFRRLEDRIGDLRTKGQLRDEPFHLRSMRFGYASYLYEHDLKIEPLRVVMGHSDLSVTFLYVRRNDKRTEKFVTKKLPTFRENSLLV